MASDVGWSHHETLFVAHDEQTQGGDIGDVHIHPVLHPAAHAVMCIAERTNFAKHVHDQCFAIRWFDSGHTPPFSTRDHSIMNPTLLYC